MLPACTLSTLPLPEVEGLALPGGTLPTTPRCLPACLPACLPTPPACLPAEEAEQASPCICTPRELASQAASFLNMLLDMFGAAEEAGGFQNPAAHWWEGAGWSPTLAAAAAVAGRLKKRGGGSTELILSAPNQLITMHATFTHPSAGCTATTCG